MNDAELLEIMQRVAVKHFGGHFTIMRFTTTWRVSFGPQPDGRDDISAMAVGRTLFEALTSALARDTDALGTVLRDALDSARKESV